MVINKKDTCLFDVDGTLVKWEGPKSYLFGVSVDGQPYDLEVDFYGSPKRVREIKIHTDFLKSLKARGYYIRVHSGNGAEWAHNVVKALKLEEYVDSIETKPAKIVDDKPMDDWAHPIYLGDQ